MDQGVSAVASKTHFCHDLHRSAAIIPELGTLYNHTSKPLSASAEQSRSKAYNICTARQIYKHPPAPLHPSSPSRDLYIFAMHAGKVNFVVLALLLVLCSTVPLPIVDEQDATPSLVDDLCKLRAILKGAFDWVSQADQDSLPEPTLVKRVPGQEVNRRMWQRWFC